MIKNQIGELTMLTLNQTQSSALLAEIFISPSKEMKPALDNNSTYQVAAGCNGSCKAGGCMTFCDETEINFS